MTAKVRRRKASDQPTDPMTLRASAVPYEDQQRLAEAVARHVGAELPDHMRPHVSKGALLVALDAYALGAASAQDYGLTEDEHDELTAWVCRPFDPERSAKL